MQVRDVDENAFQKAVKNSSTMKELIQNLGCKFHVRNVNEAKRRLKVTDSHILKIKRSEIWNTHTDDEFAALVKNATSVAEILRHYGFSGRGRNYDGVNKRIKHLGLETTHFGFVDVQNQRIIPLDDIIVHGLHPQYKSDKLRRRLIRNKIKNNQCEVCGICEWNGKPIQCQLDHIDGNNENNLLSNLRIICPNCHSQTDTFCGKNHKRKNKKPK